MDQRKCRCGNALTGRQKRHCSDACKQRALRLRSKRYPDARAVEEPFKPDGKKLDSRLRRVSPPPRRYAHQAVRQRRGSRLRVRDDIAVRESLDPRAPVAEVDSFRDECTDYTAEQKWRDICRAAHSHYVYDEETESGMRVEGGDFAELARLLRYYWPGADPTLRRKIKLALLLLSPYRWAWNEALRMVSEPGTPRDEQLWVARTVTMSHGIENFMRATGISPARLSRFMDGAPGTSRAQLYRIGKQLREKEARVNATAEILDELRAVKESTYRIEMRQLDEQERRRLEEESLLLDEDEE